MTQNNLFQYRKNRFGKCITISILFITIITSCSNSYFSSKAISPMDTLSNPITKPTPIITQTMMSVTPSRTINPLVGSISSVNVTQVQPEITVKGNEDKEYLYKDVTVTIFLVNRLEAVAYFNLDDLGDNSPEQSDLRIERTEGNEVNHMLRPINYAYYFWTKEANLTFDSCLAHFPITMSDSTRYLFQGNDFLSIGGAYCVLTNENRIAIVSYVQGSKQVATDFSEQLSFQVTVFSEIVTNQ
jgi:hypothetical protein